MYPAARQTVVSASATLKFGPNQSYNIRLNKLKLAETRVYGYGWHVH